MGHLTEYGTLVTLSTLLEERCMYSEAGPGSPYQGLEWVVHTARTYRVVDWCTRGSVHEVNSQGTCTCGQTVPNSAKQCTNVPSFLIDMHIDEVS